MLQQNAATWSRDNPLLRGRSESGTSRPPGSRTFVAPPRYPPHHDPRHPDRMRALPSGVRAPLPSRSPPSVLPTLMSSACIRMSPSTHRPATRSLGQTEGPHHHPGVRQGRPATSHLARRHPGVRRREDARAPPGRTRRTWSGSHPLRDARPPVDATGLRAPPGRPLPVLCPPARLEPAPVRPTIPTCSPGSSRKLA